MEQLNPPEPLNLDGSNLANTWRQWRQRFELFLLATGLSSKDAISNSFTCDWPSCSGSVLHVYLGEQQ